MEKWMGFLAQGFRDFDKWDRAKFLDESKEALYYIKRQLFNQIPSISAVAGLSAGAWVASTFTTSPLKGTLASWGVIRGGTHVVSTGTYKALSILLPVMAAGLAAYGVQKAMKAFRNRQLEENKKKIERLEIEAQTELKGKLGLLEEAQKAGLLSRSEFDTKKADLYQSYSRNPRSKIEDLVIKKLAG